MARVAPASESFWQMAQAMLRLFARPKTTATLPLRSIMVLLRWSVEQDSSERLNADLRRLDGSWNRQRQKQIPPLRYGMTNNGLESEEVVLGVSEGDDREAELAEEDGALEDGGFADRVEGFLLFEALNRLDDHLRIFGVGSVYGDDLRGSDRGF